MKKNPSVSIFNRILGRLDAPFQFGVVMSVKPTNSYPDFTEWAPGTVLLDRPHERVPMGSAVTKIFAGQSRAELIKVVETVDRYCPDYPSMAAHNATCVADYALYQIMKQQG